MSKDVIKNYFKLTNQEYFLEDVNKENEDANSTADSPSSKILTNFKNVSLERSSSGKYIIDEILSGVNIGVSIPKEDLKDTAKLANLSCKNVNSSESVRLELEKAIAGAFDTLQLSSVSNIFDSNANEANIKINYFVDVDEKVVTGISSIENLVHNVLKRIDMEKLEVTGVDIFEKSNLISLKNEESNILINLVPSFSAINSSDESGIDNSVDSISKAVENSKSFSLKNITGIYNEFKSPSVKDLFKYVNSPSSLSKLFEMVDVPLKDYSEVLSKSKSLKSESLIVEADDDDFEVGSSKGSDADLQANMSSVKQDFETGSANKSGGNADYENLKEPALKFKKQYLNTLALIIKTETIPLLYDQLSESVLKYKEIETLGSGGEYGSGGGISSKAKAQMGDYPASGVSTSEESALARENIMSKIMFSFSSLDLILKTIEDYILPSLESNPDEKVIYSNNSEYITYGDKGSGFKGDLNRNFIGFFDKNTPKNLNSESILDYKLEKILNQSKLVDVIRLIWNTSLAPASSLLSNANYNNDAFIDDKFIKSDLEKYSALKTKFFDDMVKSLKIDTTKSYSTKEIIEELSNNNFIKRMKLQVLKVKEDDKLYPDETIIQLGIDLLVDNDVEFFIDSNSMSKEANVLSVDFKTKGDALKKTFEIAKKHGIIYDWDDSINFELKGINSSNSLTNDSYFIYSPKDGNPFRPNSKFYGLIKNEKDKFTLKSNLSKEAFYGISSKGSYSTSRDKNSLNYNAENPDFEQFRNSPLLSQQSFNKATRIISSDILVNKSDVDQEKEKFETDENKLISTAASRAFKDFSRFMSGISLKSLNPSINEDIIQVATELKKKFDSAETNEKSKYNSNLKLFRNLIMLSKHLSSNSVEDIKKDVEALSELNYKVSYDNVSDFMDRDEYEKLISSQDNEGEEAQDVNSLESFLKAVDSNNYNIDIPEDSKFSFSPIAKQYSKLNPNNEILDLDILQFFVGDYNSVTLIKEGDLDLEQKIVVQSKSSMSMLNKKYPEQHKKIFSKENQSPVYKISYILCYLFSQYDEVNNRSTNLKYFKFNSEYAKMISTQISEEDLEKYKATYEQELGTDTAYSVNQLLLVLANSDSRVKEQFTPGMSKEERREKITSYVSSYKGSDKFLNTLQILMSKLNKAEPAANNVNVSSEGNKKELDSNLSDIENEVNNETIEKEIKKVDDSLNKHLNPYPVDLSKNKKMKGPDELYSTVYNLDDLLPENSLKDFYKASLEDENVSDFFNQLYQIKKQSDILTSDEFDAEYENENESHEEGAISDVYAQLKTSMKAIKSNLTKLKNKHNLDKDSNYLKLLIDQFDTEEFKEIMIDTIDSVFGE